MAAKFWHAQWPTLGNQNSGTVSLRTNWTHPNSGQLSFISWEKYFSCNVHICLTKERVIAKFSREIYQLHFSLQCIHLWPNTIHESIWFHQLQTVLWRGTSLHLLVVSSLSRCGHLHYFNTTRCLNSYSNYQASYKKRGEGKGIKWKNKCLLISSTIFCLVFISM
jgi:hypothetical protein